MKKFFSYILVLIFFVSAILFFVLFNIKVSVLSADKVKNIAAESNFYSFASSYIKDNIVKSSNVSLNQGSNFELLNKQITSESVKPTIDSVIDQIFLTMDGKNSEVSFPVSISTATTDKAGFSFQKNVQLKDNAVFGLMKKINLLLISLGLIAIVFLVFAILLAGETGQKLRRLGFALITVSIFLIAIWSAINFVLPHYLSQTIASAKFFQDAKLVNGLQKLITVALSKQTIYYMIEIITTVVLGVVASFVSKAETGTRRDKVIVASKTEKN